MLGIEKIAEYFKALLGAETPASETASGTKNKIPNGSVTENIIGVTERALEKIKTLHQTGNVSGRLYLSLTIKGYNANGYVSRFRTTNPFERTEGTIVIFESDELTVYSNPMSVFYLRGKEIDFEENPKPSFIVRKRNNANGNY